jgi:hypothetical protein
MFFSIIKESLLKVEREKFRLKLEDVKENFIPTEEAKESSQKIKNACYT